MKAPRLSDVISVRGRFHSSVNIPRDWRLETDRTAYIVTPSIRELTERMVKEAEARGGARSWSITGPYGSGKSAFALFFADLLAGDPPKHDVGQVIREGCSLPPDGFVPVLLVAERSPLGPALTRALADAVDEISPSLAEEVRGCCSSSGAVVARAFSRVARSLQSCGYGGLLVIVDELGKFLEFAEAAPTEGDVFLLQQVAEESQRSEAPILFLTILHSGFADYLPVNDEVRRAEWQKIQGRFRDVAFQPPAEQMIALVALAIESQAPGSLAEAWAQEVERVARPGGVLAEATRHIPVDLLHRCVPLHPVTTLLLWPLFRSKVAQNERSLFAFLTSGEGFGFQEYLRCTAWDGGELPFLRPAWLHDYIPWALGARAFMGDRAATWALIEDGIRKLPQDTPPGTEDVLKTLGLLSMYGSGVGLPASKPVIDAAVGFDSGPALEVLAERSLIVFRRHAGGYALWEGSDFDPNAAFSAAREHLCFGDIVERLKRSLPLRPIVARRHYAETGTLRFLEVDIVPAELDKVIEALDKPTHADGRVVYVIPSDGETWASVAEQLRSVTAADERRLRLLAVPKSFADIERALADVECWGWVLENTPELRGDRIARREVRSRHSVAMELLERTAGQLFGLAGSPFQPAFSAWVAGGEIHQIRSARHFQRWISRRCARVFASAPTLHNELLNRRTLSSAAAAGRRNLLQGMVERANESRLGIQGTPAEASMYEAVLRRGGFHREEEHGWSLGAPSGDWEPAWDTALAFLESTREARRPVGELLDELRSPPFGILDGALPVLITMLLLVHRDEIALYEDGVFVPDFRIEVVERLVRSPGTFEIQSHRLDSGQIAALQALRSVLAVGDVEGIRIDAADLLPVVKLLIGFVVKLHPYVRKTKRLDPLEAAAVRDRLLDARDPRALLFEELPEALGVTLDGGADAAEFAIRLHQSLMGLAQAYPRLLDEIERPLRETFGLDGSAVAARASLAARACPLAGFAGDGRLGLFVREAASNHPDRDWRETLGRVLQGGLPPTHWSDRDLPEFRVRLQEVAGEFARLEELAIERGNNEANRVLRIGVLDGVYAEYRQIITLDEARSSEVSELAAHLDEALRSNGGGDSSRVRLAALAHVARRLLGSEEKVRSGR